VAPLAAAAAVTAVVAATVIVPSALHGSGPAAGHRSAAATAYVSYPGKYNSAEELTPISGATNTPGRPIRMGTLGGVAFTPDGKTAYVEGPTGAVLPISTATSTPGKPIPVRMPGYRPFSITMNPDGETAYLTFSWHIGSSFSGSILPISTATNTPGKPIRVTSARRPYVLGIVFSPDGKTAYAAAGSLVPIPGSPTQINPAAVIPVNTATNTPGKPIRLSHGESDITITPDGKTLYVAGWDTITPISTATNTPGKPIRVSTGAGNPANMAITPDGKTLYAAAQQGVVPISTATNTPGKPIRPPSYRGEPSLWITP